MSDVRLTVAIPTAGMVRMGFAYSLSTLVARIAAVGMPTRPESVFTVKIDVQESSVIHTNREQLVRRAIEGNQTHLLFLDDDMTFEPQVLDVLFSRRHPIVTTNYLIKTPACDSFVAVGLDGKRVPTTEASTGLQPILYSGFGVSLFDLDVFKATPQPWFQPVFIPEESAYTTEDNPCYQRLRSAGYDVLLDHDASKLITHVGNKAWSWKEFRNAH